MCGINGYARTDGALDAAVVEAMNEALLHRGPDEGGVAVLEDACVGMRRLSIVDLAGGHQPMHTAGRRHTIVYNGELYDHHLLRDALTRQGVRFRTRSDTEALLESWAHRGEACLDDLNGMFAFAVHDREDGSLTLVRDPVGIKPLYYWHGPDGELVFSSELGSLMAHPRVPRRLDRRSLASLLVDRCVVDPFTMLEGVRQLPPGHLLRWRAGRVEVRPYASLELAPEALGEGAALAELRQRLDEAVRSQLVADVPVGVFLSGGIDSSTVAAHAARAVDGELHSFTVGFDDAGFDESAIAREVADHLGTTHHELRVEDASFAPEILDTVIEHCGQPLGDLSCIPTYLVSRFARERVKVILSGDGGDEFFGGYDHIRWAARVRRVGERAPALVRRVGSAVLAGVAPVAMGTAVAERTRRARKGLALTFCEPLEQVRRMMALWEPEEAARLLGEREAQLHPWPAGEARALEALAPEELAMVVLARTYMTSAILTKVDRMSMAASLEVRVPLLDRRVIDLALRCPLDLKLRGGVGKHLLREAGRPLLPAAVYSHPKKGFGLPLHAWFNDEFWDLVDELYRPGAPAAGLFEERALRRVLSEGREAGRAGRLRSRQNVSSRVWLLAQLGRWMQRYEVAA
jgi:asparagine synthase (glutamine-hydrolysing)